MTNFTASGAVALSVGNAAEALPSLILGVQDSSDPGGLIIRRGPQFRITNTHSSQTMNYARDAVASATVGIRIDFGQSIIVPAPFPDESPTLFASGSATTGILEVGAVSP